ncbi:uncharacterized protein LOC134462656 [Engraulis encrasicolus]|uniref:uncharacterized protein LOC134462656 n=1 Tax=Engraulis encrasicolus TaxID=184585 RepID=UPI002FD4BC2B
MGYIGRKRKWKSGYRPSEPANPSGQSSPQPGPSGEPAALSHDQAATSSKRSRSGTANPLPRAATPLSSPQLGPSTEVAGASSSTSSRPGAANTLPRAVGTPRSPQLGTFREHVSLVGAASSTSSRPGAASPLPRAVDRPRSPQPVAFRQVFEPMDVPGAGAPPPPQASGATPDQYDHVLDNDVASLPRSIADTLATLSPLLATMLVFGNNDINIRVLLENFLGETNWQLNQMLYHIMTYYNGGQPVASRQVFEPMEVPGAGPQHGAPPSPHAPPQAFGVAPDQHNHVLDNDLPRSIADTLGRFSTLLATMLVYSNNDINITGLLENFLGETNMKLTYMIYDIVTYYNGGLPLMLFDPEITPEDTRCPICLDDYEVDQELSILPCRHFFHNMCVQHWLQRSRTCPVCRAGVGE